MASKAEMYAQMADQAAVQVTKSWQEWTAFLTTASRLYKYPYHEQLMIYAQRPDATACAEYDLWNKRMGRYIKRGSRGIALVDDSGDCPRLRYVFDVADTGEREQSRRPYLWVMQPDYAGRVMDMIEQRYGIAAQGDLVQQLADLAGRLTEDYWLDNRRDILRIVDGIKALCAGDPRIKERMDLDVEVSRLKLMKADHQSQQFRLEDNLLKFFPEQIEKCRGYIHGFEADMQTLKQHPHPENGFAGMAVRGDVLTDKENAGAALLDACKEVTDGNPVQVGSYRGFAVFACFNAFKTQYEVTLRGEMSHNAVLEMDPRGNLVRLDNALAQMPQRLASVQAQLENLCQQRDAAQADVGKPFPQEEELQVKSARLLQLDMELNMDRRTGARAGQAAVAKSERPSVLEKLREPAQRGMPDKDHKKKEVEVR